MLVYNLTSNEVHYMGRPIPPNGGSLEFPSMTYVPTRDLALQKNKVLAFGSLPAWWNFLVESKLERQPNPAPPIPQKAIEAPEAPPEEKPTKDLRTDSPSVKDGKRRQ